MLTKPRTHADLAATLSRALADNPDRWIKYDLDTHFFMTLSDTGSMGDFVLDLTYHPDRSDNVRTMIQHALDAILSPTDNTGLTIYIRHYTSIHNLSIWVRR